MKVLIIGGVATGPKVAARLKRLRPDVEITVVEQGEAISYGACGLPLYLGNIVPELAELQMTNAGLVRDVKYFREQKGVKFLTATQAVKINRKEKNVLAKNLKTSEEQLLPYDFLVLATGAKPFRPPIPGTELKRVYTLHHPEDAQTIKQMLQEKKAKHITILGAGLIGVETADALSGPRLKVTVCEALDSVLPKLLDPDMATLVAKQMRSRGVDLRLQCSVKALEGNAEGEVCRVLTAQGVIETEAVIIAAGVRPNVRLAKEAGLEIGVTDAIKVDKHLRTSDPFIFAGGDCAEQTHVLTGKPIYIPLASTANKQGRVIADNIAGRPTEFSAVLGTSVLQAFDLNIGRTGLSEAEAKEFGYDVITSVVSGLDATHYYPMHAGLTIKLIADNASGKLLGAQVCGQGEGIKRLDVLATALKFGAKVEDLSNLDLGYAPPFATAIDIVIHAANTLQNKREGIVPSLNAPEMVAELAAGQKYCFVDVREQDEVQANPLPLPDVLHIPLGELRGRWPDIPAEQTAITVCELGIRSYEAACILKGLGRDKIAYLEGGTSTLKAYYDALP